MENQKKSAHQKSLSLLDLSSAFVVFGLGVCLSILAFLVELIFKRISHHRVIPGTTVTPNANAKKDLVEKADYFNAKYFW